MADLQILVVEDESIVAKGIQNMLETLGYGVPAVAASGEEAAGAGLGPEAFKPVTEKLGLLVEQNKKGLESNATMLTALETIDKRLKRIYMGFSSMYRR